MAETYVYDPVSRQVRPKGEVEAEKAARMAAERLQLGLDGSPTAPQLLRNRIAKRERRIVAETLPRNWEYAPAVDEYGRACFSSRREIDEAVAKSQWNDEHAVHYEWDEA